MPLYVTSVIYKVAAFTLTIAYLRLWSFATMLLLIIELVVLAKCSGLGDCASWMYPVFSNFFIVNIGGVDIEQKEKEKTIKDMNKMYKLLMYRWKINDMLFQLVSHTHLGHAMQFYSSCCWPQLLFCICHK